MNRFYALAVATQAHCSIKKHTAKGAWGVCEIGGKNK